MSRHASVAKPRGTPVLRVGRAAYKAVLVPSLKTMRRSTLALLKKFKAAGGTVVFVGEAAGAIEGAASDEVKAFAASCVNAEATGSALSATLKVARRLTIRDAEDHDIGAVLYLLREDQDAFYLFVCNTGEEFWKAGVNDYAQRMARDRTLAFGDVRIRGLAGCKGAPQELNPETGGIATADAVRDGDGWEIRTALPALGSRLFVAPKEAHMVGRSPVASAPVES